MSHLDDFNFDLIDFFSFPTTRTSRNQEGYYSPQSTLRTQRCFLFFNIKLFLRDLCGLCGDKKYFARKWQNFKTRYPIFPAPRGPGTLQRLLFIFIVPGRDSHHEGLFPFLPIVLRKWQKGKEKEGTVFGNLEITIKPFPFKTDFVQN
jgi:hypothetical protein